ncbi:ATPase SWSAP1-like [Acipenser ruthenus]|uniref:ATPase SWSAP1-like n=1 Tax=Acipenser ruthenus TaxID=7906 RepID=UPI002741A332|nr:ATPase SWSAP1-like [Acipenser ruthenus]
MAEMLMRVFRHYSGAGEVTSASDANYPSLSPNNNNNNIDNNNKNKSSHCVVLGEAGCGKTALLFLSAVMAASEFGVRVVFLSRTPIHTLPAPLQGARAGVDLLSLKKIQFKYPRSAVDLLRDVASLHENDKTLPSLIVIDGLDQYLRSAGDHSQQSLIAARLSALLADTASFVSQKLTSARSDGGSGNAPQECQVIISLNSEAGDESPARGQALSVIERYFSAKCLLEREPEFGDTAWRVRFSGAQQSSCDLGMGWRLMYSQSGAMEFHAVPGENSQTPGNSTTAPE